MSTTVVILVAAAVVAIALALAFYYRRKRTEQLHNRFGPEYERAVTQLGDRQEAESELEGRAKRVKQFHIHAISAEERRRFADASRADQARFVDEPEQAVAEAHGLVSELMRARGYPVSTEFQQNAADLSVDHPRVVEHYRTACIIGSRRESGQANTEDLRAAMVHDRELFEELLGRTVQESEEVRR